MPEKKTPYYIHHTSDVDIDDLEEIVIASIDPGTVTRFDKISLLNIWLREIISKNSNTPPLGALLTSCIICN